MHTELDSGQLGKEPLTGVCCHQKELYFLCLTAVGFRRTEPWFLCGRYTTEGGRLSVADMAYVALHEMTWCMVVWCTQNAPR